MLGVADAVDVHVDPLAPIRLMPFECQVAGILGHHHLGQRVGEGVDLGEVRPAAQRAHDVDASRSSRHRVGREAEVT